MSSQTWCHHANEKKVWFHMMYDSDSRISLSCITHRLMGSLWVSLNLRDDVEPAKSVKFSFPHAIHCPPSCPFGSWHTNPYLPKVDYSSIMQQSGVQMEVVWHYSGLKFMHYKKLWFKTQCLILYPYLLHQGPSSSPLMKTLNRNAGS